MAEDDSVPPPGDVTRTGILNQLPFLRPKLAQRPCFLGVQGSRSVGKLFLLEDGMVIGRANDADIILDEEGVSRKHARISVLRDAVRITDMDSSNGIRVDGAKVKVHALRDGQRVRIGEATLTLVRLDEDLATIRRNLLESADKLDEILRAPSTPRR
jgi:pSer/pThr/pTyr-binding forkhead associated (FHA) protein